MFLEIIRKKGYQSLSFIGMAKNVGKTTAFNYLLRECFQNKYIPGLASIGRDGEKIDAITGGEKPTIWVAEKTIIAASQEAIIQSNASLEILENTGYTSSLGPIYLAQVHRAGLVEIATTPSARKMKNIIKLMQEFGAELVMVDGALDRVSAAAPKVTESTILATGASVHKNLDIVVQKTIAQVQQLAIPAVSPDKGEISEALLAKIKKATSSLIVGEDSETIFYMDKQSLGYEKSLLRFLENQPAKLIYINGAVVNGLLDIFIANKKKLQESLLLIRNGTNILADQNTWDKYLKAHGHIRALHPINLTAIICNPISYRGENFIPEELVEKIAGGVSDVLNEIIVADLILGLVQQVSK